MLSTEELTALGFQGEETLAAAQALCADLEARGHGRTRLKSALRTVLRRPQRFEHNVVFGALARLLMSATPPDPEMSVLRAQPVPNRIWGRRLIDDAALQQFATACRLPIAARGAQMADGHVGYGLPIGGVLATRGAVIPYAVGVDIACRMRLSIFDEPIGLLQSDPHRLKSPLIRQTRFGIGAAFEAGERRSHEVLDDPLWSEDRLLGGLKDKAWQQLGTSGTGNHFVEWGELTLDEPLDELGLSAGTYLALLSHSGSRGVGAKVADHYTRLARAITNLPEEAKALAWLPLDGEEGDGYWRAMNLCGRYAAANHQLIHESIARAGGFTPRAHVENHHNFAWREEHDGEELIVHRKGATPAGRGVLGVIPGSMGDAGYVVRGLGNGASLDSASHGAGRVLSRKQAVKTLTLAERAKWLEAAGVELLAGGLDESPQVYKRLDEVMREQRDLVEPLARFVPRIVLMAHGGRAED
jgi:tRNA-splicing ligase RtcB